LLNKTHFQEESSMCANTHAKYRNVRNGLPEKSDFPPEKGHFVGKRAENAVKIAGNSQDPDSENGSNQPL